MAHADRQRWLGTAILVGVIYPVVGVMFAQLSGAAGSARIGFIWRLSAFLVSGLVFGAHIAYEHLRLRSPARPLAWHTAAAVAIGGFLLALVANIHDLGSSAGYRPRMLIALAAWPLLTAVPAYIVALLLAAGLGMKRPRV
jgi:hypothetical protein